MDILWAIAILFFFSFLPLLELRASIPVGFFALESMGAAPLDWWWVVPICIVANVLQGILVFEVLLPILAFFRGHWPWFATKIWPHVEKRQEKLRPSVERYGWIGLAIFIGVPLPGTGAMTGALGAFLLGFRRNHFYLANFLGVLIAAIAVTAICLLIQEGILAEDSWVSKLFIKQ